MEFKKDLLKTYENTSKSFSSSLDQANKIYYNVLSLIITLSSSSLLISIALVEKLFPVIDQGKIILPNFLITSWILLTISIIFGIIAELDAATFHGNLAKESAAIMKDLKKKIAKGMTTEDCIEDDDESYIISNTILWGAISINAYIFALLFMCLVLLAKIISIDTRNNIIILVTTFVVLINIILIRKRNRVSKCK